MTTATETRTVLRGTALAARPAVQIDPPEKHSPPSREFRSKQEKRKALLDGESTLGKVKQYTDWSSSRGYGGVVGYGGSRSFYGQAKPSVSEVERSAGKEFHKSFIEHNKCTTLRPCSVLDGTCPEDHYALDWTTMVRAGTSNPERAAMRPVDTLALPPFSETSPIPSSSRSVLSPGSAIASGVAPSLGRGVDVSASPGPSSVLAETVLERADAILAEWDALQGGAGFVVDSHGLALRIPRPHLQVISHRRSLPDRISGITGRLVPAFRFGGNDS